MSNSLVSSNLVIVEGVDNYTSKDLNYSKDYYLKQILPVDNPVDNLWITCGKQKNLAPKKRKTSKGLAKEVALAPLKDEARQKQYYIRRPLSHKKKDVEGKAVACGKGVYNLGIIWG
jgi:hypothetical protein